MNYESFVDKGQDYRNQPNHGVGGNQGKLRNESVSSRLTANGSKQTYLSKTGVAVWLTSVGTRISQFVAMDVAERLGTITLSVIDASLAEKTFRNSSRMMIGGRHRRFKSARALE